MCSHKVCQSNCQWSGCQLKAGNQCDWEAGTNWRCCAKSKWQYCLNPSQNNLGKCIWSPECVTCSGCGCN